MKKFVVAAAVFLFLAASIPSQAALPVRYASCDACGYCPTVVNGTSPSCQPDNRPLPTGNPVPGNWAACVRCLYPTLYPTSAPLPVPDDCKTVKIDPNTAEPSTVPAPITPIPGRQYTMLGCLTTEGNVFQNTAATGASSFVQAIFDFLIFRVVGGIAFLYLMYGAFIMMTSQADPEKLNYGRRVLIGAIVGLLFSLGSVLIVNIIGSGILRIPGFSGSITPTPIP